MLVYWMRACTHLTLSLLFSSVSLANEETSEIRPTGSGPSNLVSFFQGNEHNAAGDLVLQINESARLTRSRVLVIAGHGDGRVIRAADGTPMNITALARHLLARSDISQYNAILLDSCVSGRGPARDSSVAERLLREMRRLSREAGGNFNLPIIAPNGVLDAQELGSGRFVLSVLSQRTVDQRMRDREAKKEKLTRESHLNQRHAWSMYSIEGTGEGERVAHTRLNAQAVAEKFNWLSGTPGWRGRPPPIGFQGCADLLNGILP